MEVNQTQTDAMVQLTVRVMPEQAQRLKRWAEKLGVSQGDIVRLLLDEWYSHRTSILNGDKVLR